MTKYEAVAQAIKADIENGVYTEGQAIPTEELLTAQYDVRDRKSTRLNSSHP